MRYYIGFLITIGLIFVLIFLLFSGGGKKGGPTVTAPLISYANTSSEVRLTIDGPINADQIHGQVRITVNQYTVTFDQIQGYDGTVVNQKQFNNSENAYNVFLHALNIAGFTEGDSRSSLSDERGYCALGDRYIVELIQGGNDLERFWATNCGGTKSYGGNLTLTLDLFEAQVPNYQTLIQTTNI